MRENDPDSFPSFSMPGRADLHVHTTASDGSLSVPQVLTLACQIGLKAVGIADHDTTSGLIGLDFSKWPVEVVPAVEINSEYEGKEVHILGYFIPLENEKLQKSLEKLRISRRQRITRTIERFSELSMPLNKEKIFQLAGGDSVGRPHVAKALIEAGYVKTVKEAFQKYLAIGKPGYVEREHLVPGQCVQLIRESGGVPVWAHPGTANADALLTELVEKGLQGLEVFHPEHNEYLQTKYMNYARLHNLVITGGSDFHGVNAREGADLGSVTVPYDYVDKLKARRGK